MPGQVPGPGGDLGRGVVAEPVQLDQVEAPLGLGGLQPVDAGVPGRREEPLPGARVVAALAQQPGAGDVHPDEHEGDVHAHERADQVQDVLVVGAVHAQPGDVVQQQRLGAVVADRGGDLADQVRQVHVPGVGAP